MGQRISDESREKQGRGKGEGVNWIPWIQKRDFSGSTKFNQIPSFKFPGRNIETFSSIEENLIYMVDVADNVIDFYEQYPLLPLTETIKISKEQEIEHIPFAANKKAVVTTDLVVRLKNKKLVAICVKSWMDLKDPRVIAKIQIEQLYWKKRKVKWILVTEREFEEIQTENLRQLRQYIFINDKFQKAVYDELKQAVKDSDERIGEVLKKCSKHLKLTYANTIEIFFQLIATKQVRVDLSKMVSIERYVSELTF